ncbi:MAG: 4Fe-4S dicluster domain-containing protein [Planctomycetota bacterium]|jgi:molybdopterin-containing oxidoreductase family iron-sulfur binding subunit
MRLPILNAGPDRRGVARRSFLRSAVAVTGGLAAFGAALSPLRKLSRETDDSFANFFQKHYKELTAGEMKSALERIRTEVNNRYGVDATVSDPKPLDGVEFVYALNLSRCNGNRRCVHACVSENNQSRNPEMQYIRVIEVPNGTFNLDEGNHHYDGDVPKKDHYYLPVQCHQCANPPCVKVCPVEATWQEPDGITVIDYDWCIGCRYCEAACPYWARRFNFSAPEIPADELNTEISYLSNRPRTRGVMEKCTYCLHRTRTGRLPACLEACPTGARKFGNVLDPNSEVSKILQTKRVFVLKEELGTLPRFFYYFDERHPRTGAPDAASVPASEPEAVS